MELDYKWLLFLNHLNIGIRLFFSLGNEYRHFFGPAAISRRVAVIRPLAFKTMLLFFKGKHLVSRWSGPPKHVPLLVVATLAHLLPPEGRIRDQCWLNFHSYRRTHPSRISHDGFCSLRANYFFPFPSKP